MARFEETGHGHRPRRYENVDPPRPRPANRLRVVPAKSFGAALQYFTGSKDHNVILRGMAKDRGLRINEYGVFRVAAKQLASSPKAAEDSERRRRADNVDSGFAELRRRPHRRRSLRHARSALCSRPRFAKRDRNSLGRPPASCRSCIEVTDLVGDLHMHTTASDGKASLREMVVAAIERGLKYIAITDHSPRVSMANGLNPARLREQWNEIDKLNREFDDFTILKGIECDILEKGGMDLPDDVLAEADWVIASVHYGQQQSREQITDRILGALENPHVSIIAHPTGRIIGRREPYAVDLEAVFAAAARNGKFMEINANPARLDLDDVAVCRRQTARHSPSSSAATPTAPAASTCFATASCKPAAPA